MFSAFRIRLIRSYKPGFAVSGMLREIPRSNAQKSLMLTAPARTSTAPKTSSVMREIPMSKNRLSHAAMKAK